MAPVRIGTPVDELDTPALLVEIARLERNLRSWQDAVAAHGVRLRPHVKTHKSPAIAALQLAAGACGIAAAKPSEAEVFVAAGVRDVVIAYPVVGEPKWERVACLAARGAAVAVNVDGELAARGLAAAATRHGVRIGVQIEIDSGLHRVGFPPGDFRRIEALARLVESLPGLALEGVTTHRGVGFAGADRLTPVEAGRAEGELLVAVAERLRERGLEIREVTAGGTPTGRAAAAVPGVTEIRAGTYVFNDLMQLASGAAQPAELALSILCTVVSRGPGRATIDGGSKTFSGDRSVDGGVFARAVDRDATVGRLTEEHGMVEHGAGLLEVGEKVAWYPVHACTCVNLADELLGIRDGVVEAVWPVAARGLRA